MKLKDELMKYLDAGYPVIYINSYEESKTDSIIKSSVGGRKVFEWNGAVGFCDFENKSPYLSGFRDLEETLEILVDEDEFDRKLLVIKDPSEITENSRITALIKHICHKIEYGMDSAIIIVSAVFEIPRELEKYITILEMEDLETDEIRDVVKYFIEEQNNKNEPVSDQLIEKMVVAFKGLSAYDIENLLSSAISTTGSITDESLYLIKEQKRQMIMKSNVLEMINYTETINDIGGLKNLKKWLMRKAKIFESVNEAAEFGVDMPKGVLICGVPGCGKSLTAKATAACLKVPLLRLDMGRIMGMYLGESEKNMRKAISLAEAISPCVLWADELEKAFSGSNGSGHEVTVRLMGTLLTWLQEKKSPVFVVATANKIDALPPELLRKGRFDEMFFVDFPNAEEREAIFKIHIKKRREKDLDKCCIESLAEETEGFCGADIESVVIQAVELAFCSEPRQCLNKDLLLDVIKNTSSISKTMKIDVEKYREQFNNMNHASIELK